MKFRLMSETQPSIESIDALVGMAFQLVACSQWQHIPLRDLASHLIPPIRLGQFDFLINDRDRPVAFAAWAFFDNDAVGDRIKCSTQAPALGDWNGGDQLFFTTIIAPIGRTLTFSLKLAKRLERSNPESASDAKRNQMIGVWRQNHPFLSQARQGG